MPNFSLGHNCTSRGKMRVKCPRLMFSSWVSKIKRHSASPNFSRIRISAEKVPLGLSKAFERSRFDAWDLRESHVISCAFELRTFKQISWVLNSMGQHGSPKLTALGFKTENLSILASQSFHHRFAVKSGAVCDRPMTRLLAEPATERSTGRIGLACDFCGFNKWETKILGNITAEWNKWIRTQSNRIGLGVTWQCLPFLQHRLPVHEISVCQTCGQTDHSTACQPSAAIFFTDLEVVWLAPPGAAQWRQHRCFYVFLIVSGRETKGMPRVVKTSTEGHQEMCKM